LSVVEVSHVVNIVVAGVIGLLILGGSPRMTRVYGEDSPARRILACLYLAIAAASAYALLDAERLIAIAVVLFPVQIVYKLLTLVVVRDRRNPVLWWNLAISVLHAVALGTIGFSPSA
jgi:hypothetical protein